MLAVCYRERIPVIMLINEIAQQESSTAFLYGSGKKFQRDGYICGFALRLVVKEFTDKIEDVFAAFLGRYELLYPVAEEHQAYLIVILDSGKCQRGGYLGNHLTFHHYLRTEIKAVRYVHHEHYSKFTLLLKNL